MALDRATVVRAALRLLDEVGLHGLSLRKVASELGVQAPALYWHFKNKQELLDEMATTAFADNIDMELPSPGVASRPAKPGETILFFGVGFGAVTPNIAAGQIVTQANQLSLSLQILFGRCRRRRRSTVWRQASWDSISSTSWFHRLPATIWRH
jgi:AcrR family transcriptional regulator